MAVNSEGIHHAATNLESNMSANPDWREGAAPFTILPIGVRRFPFGDSEITGTFNRGVDLRAVEDEMLPTSELRFAGVVEGSGEVVLFAVGVKGNDALRVVVADSSDETLRPGSRVRGESLTGPRTLRRGGESVVMWPLPEGHIAEMAYQEAAGITESIQRFMEDVLNRRIEAAYRAPKPQGAAPTSTGLQVTL